jgi:hypothetical protein
MAYFYALQKYSLEEPFTKKLIGIASMKTMGSLLKQFAKDGNLSVVEFLIDKWDGRFSRKDKISAIQDAEKRGFEEIASIIKESL